jgi:hypothetical protein
VESAVRQVVTAHTRTEIRAAHRGYFGPHHGREIRQHGSEYEGRIAPQARSHHGMTEEVHPVPARSACALATLIDVAHRRGFSVKGIEPLSSFH